MPSFRIAEPLPAMVALAAVGAAHASVIGGTLSLTRCQGSLNVSPAVYANHDVARGFALQTEVAIAKTCGATSIIVTPNWDLLIGSAATASVYQVSPGGATVGTGTASKPVCRLSLDPGDTKIVS